MLRHGNEGPGRGNKSFFDQGGDERNSFLSRYYAPERESAYDTAFARGIAPVMAGQSKQNAYHANRFAAKTAADMARHVSGKD